MPQARVPASRYVFVYGTLRRGDDNDINKLLPAPRFVGCATLKGRLFHLGRYPGVLLGGDSDVVGEVYEICDVLEQQLDEIEELYPQQTHEYSKREVSVAVAGRTLTCLVYEVNPDVAQGRPVLASGDWVRDR